MQQKTFIKESNIPASVIRSVSRQMGGWDELQERAADVSNYGASGGFGGFIYYSDTLSFFSRNKRGIIAMAEELANDLGEDPVSMVRGFNCLDATVSEVAGTMYGSKRDTQVANALAWFALEEVCRDLVRIQEGE